MAEDNIITGDDEDDAPAKKKMAGKTVIMFIVLPALLILCGGMATAMLLSGGGKEEPVEVADASHESHGDDHAKDDHGAKDDHAKTDDHAKDDGHGKKDDHAKKDSHGKDDHGGGYANHSPEGPTRETGTLQVGNAGDPSYYIMPDLLVNLSSQQGDRQLFLKLKLTLEAEDPEMFSEIPKLLPRITDQYQMFLRELRVDDLNGSAGGLRLRTELLRRINLAISPSRVDAVLIEEMLVQ